MPSRDQRSSGQKYAEPAYAASTWSHTPSSAPVEEIKIQVLSTRISKRQLNVLTLQTFFYTDIIRSEFEDVQTGPSSDRLSKAHTPVVPKVAHS